jgi:hypothetical protein
MGEIKVLEGKKISDEELKTLDRSKMGVALVGAPRNPEVEGQWLHPQWVQCPWCGNMGRVIVDTNIYLWFTCGLCGGAFRA